MFRFKIILVALILAAISVYSINYYNGTVDSIDFGQVKGAVNMIIDPLNKSSKCEIEDNISYLLYTNTNPSEQRNNKFGLYIYAEEERFIKLADELVNSNGGDWGYVLIPYNVADRDRTRWNRVFQQLRDKHLIPVIQLHDVDTDKYESQTEDAAEFLNSFIWPTKSRYISAYNEPNDARFWYGRVAPEEYARILDYTINTFKAENSDFFVMNGALNISTSTHKDGSHLDAFDYMRRMDREVPGIFSKLDGWASHPYPMPEFTGNPNSKGRWSIRAYEDELNFLSEVLEVEKELPVFITETGWAHAEGKIYDSRYLPVDTISEYFKIAYEDVWLKDDRVVAVMPFTIRYDPPFDHFSWIDSSNKPYKHFEIIKEMKKVAGNPPHLIEKNVKLIGCR